MRAILIPLAIAAAAPAGAQSALPPARLANNQLADPAAEAAAREVMDGVRCLVCAGQSVADSDAAMAGDMRAVIRERVAAGETPEAVRDWLVSRYGDVVVYAPPWSAASAPLWIAPLLLLLGGAWLARGSFRRRRS